MKFYTNVNNKGNYIYESGYDNGVKYNKKVKYKPTIYKRTNSINSEIKTLMENENVLKLHLNDISEFNAIVKQEKEFIEYTNPIHYGFSSILTNYLIYTYPQSQLEFDISKVKTVIIDIETAFDEVSGYSSADDALNPITMIAVKQVNKGNTVIFSLTENSFDSKEVSHFSYNSESEMLTDFIKYIKALEIDAITGWNIDNYDIPYIINRMNRLNVDFKKLSPYSIVEKKYNSNEWVIFGINILDYMNIFKKFAYAYQLESYALDNVGEAVVNEGKVDYSEYGSLHNLYYKNYKLFTEYCIKDVLLIEKIENETNLLEQVYIMGYFCGSNFIDTLGTTFIWQSIVGRTALYDFKRVPQLVNKKSDKVEYPGAYVIDVIPGIHKNVATFDVASMYPNLIRTFNMSVETKLSDNDIKNNPEIPYCTTAAGIHFRTDKEGIFGNLMSRYYNKRLDYKAELKNTYKDIEKIENNLKESKTDELLSLYEKKKHDVGYYNNLQMVMKILINSFYGSCGNNFFQYFDIDIAKSITLSGQDLIKSSYQFINEIINKTLKNDEFKSYVVGGDTDSGFFCMDEVVQKYMKNKNKDEQVKGLVKFSEEIVEPYLKKSLDEKFKNLNVYNNTIEMQRENIGDMCLIAKKNYFMRILNSEGKTVDKMKITGIKGVKPSAPKIVRKPFSEIFRLILTKTESEIKEYIRNFEKQFMEASPTEIAFNKKVNIIKPYVDSKGNLISIVSGGRKQSAPINSRAAILHNQMVEYDYQKIKESDNIQFVMLKVPNVYVKRQDVIALSSNFIPEKKWIDYKLQFEKCFIKSIGDILSAVNINLHEEKSLESFIEF